MSSNKIRGFKPKIHWGALLKALLLGAPHGTLSRTIASQQSVFSVGFWAYRFPLLYMLWLESRSLPYRIQELHERGVDIRELDLGAEIVIRAEGLRETDVDFHDRIKDKQNLQTAHPWVTQFDLMIFLQGRQAGMLSHISRMNRTSESQESPSVKALNWSSEYRGSNSMLPQITQQELQKSDSA